MKSPLEKSCHLGPVILIEAGCVFKAALFYIKDKFLFDGIDLQRLPGYPYVLSSSSLQDFGKIEDRIGDAAGM